MDPFSAFHGVTISIRAAVILAIALVAAASGAGVAEWRRRTAMPHHPPPALPPTPSELAEWRAAAKKAFLFKSEIFDRLQHAQSYEILSIQPRRGAMDSGFHGFPILGRTVVTDTKQRGEINDAIVLASKEAGGLSKCMFSPRHGLHVVTRNEVVDLVICFQCGDVEAYHQDRPINRFQLSARPETIIDGVLTAAGVELAAKAR